MIDTCKSLSSPSAIAVKFTADHSRHARRAGFTIEDFSTWIASKEELIVSKLWWAKDSRSEQQLRDVRNLAGTGCDTAYTERWTTELGLNTLWEQCQK